MIITTKSIERSSEVFSELLEYMYGRKGSEQNWLRLPELGYDPFYLACDDNFRIASFDGFSNERYETVRAHLSGTSRFSIAVRESVVFTTYIPGPYGNSIPRRMRNHVLMVPRREVLQVFRILEIYGGVESFRLVLESSGIPANDAVYAHRAVPAFPYTWDIPYGEVNLLFDALGVYPDHLAEFMQ